MSSSRKTNIRFVPAPHAPLPPFPSLTADGYDPDVFEHYRPIRRTSTGSKPTIHFACDMENCRKMFKTRAALKKHQDRYHSGDRKFCCKHCPKQFTKRHHLHQHLWTHSGFKRFVCRCGERFNRKDRFEGHIKSHLFQVSPEGSILQPVVPLHPTDQAQPYGCNLCGEFFVTSSEMMQHTRTKHPGLAQLSSQGLFDHDLDDIGLVPLKISMFENAGGSVRNKKQSTDDDLLLRSHAVSKQFDNFHRYNKAMLMSCQPDDDNASVITQSILTPTTSNAGWDSDSHSSLPCTPPCDETASTASSGTNSPQFSSPIVSSVATPVTDTTMDQQIPHDQKVLRISALNHEDSLDWNGGAPSFACVQSSSIKDKLIASKEMESDKTKKCHFETGGNHKAHASSQACEQSGFEKSSENPGLSLRCFQVSIESNSSKVSGKVRAFVSPPSSDSDQSEQQWIMFKDLATLVGFEQNRVRKLLSKFSKKCNSKQDLRRVTLPKKRYFVRSDCMLMLLQLFHKHAVTSAANVEPPLDQLGRKTIIEMLMRHTADLTAQCR